MRNLLIYYILCFLALCSCSDSHTSIVLDEAEALYDKALYEEADSVLRTIDAIALKPGSELQARYALLHTKIKYKNYVDAPNDSLISISVEYAEAKGDAEDRFYAYLYQGIVRFELNDYSKATQSLLRAMANSENISDHYSKGQMFTYLSLVNGVQHCSDDEKYAQMAFEQYLAGGLDTYYASALNMKAIAKLHRVELDSAMILLDAAITKAESTGSIFALNEALSLKAHTALFFDSIQMANHLYMRLDNDKSYTFQIKDLCNMAYIQAKLHNTDSCFTLLSKARLACATVNDTINYLAKSLWVYNAIGDNEYASMLKDTLISLEDRMLAESSAHSSLSHQRDYAEWQKSLTEEKAKETTSLLTSIILIISLATLLLYVNYQKKVLLSNLQEEKIKNLQSQIIIHNEEIERGLSELKNSEIANYFRGLAVSKGTTTIKRWSELENLFEQKLPHFEKSLRELTSMSEIEWHLCMLLKLGFSPGEMAIVLQRSSASISLIRKRLYEKVHHKKGIPSDWDAFINQM